MKVLLRAFGKLEYIMESPYQEYRPIYLVYRKPLSISFKEEDFPFEPMTKKARFEYTGYTENIGNKAIPVYNFVTLDN